MNTSERLSESSLTMREARNNLQIALDAQDEATQTMTDPAELAMRDDYVYIMAKAFEKAREAYKEALIAHHNEVIDTD